MKALLINGSPRPNGCTFTALTELANTLEAEGIETEIVHVGNKDIRGCIACRRCHSTGSNKCVFDDIVNEVAPKLAEADAFVIGAPVYFGSPAGGAISFMDRLFFMSENDRTTLEQAIYEEMELTPEMIRSIRTLCGVCLCSFVESKAFKIAIVPSADRSMDTCTVCQTRRGHDYVVMNR